MVYESLAPNVLLLGSLVWIFALVFIAIYVYSALALMFIAKRTNTKYPWLAWIPVANIYLMTQIGGLSGWFTLLIFASIIPWVGGVLILAVTTWFWWKISQARGKPGWWALIMIIPIVNFVVMGILAWGE